MKNELIIYVAIIHCVFDSGIGEYTEDGILYAGADYNKAKEVLNNYDTSNSLFRLGYIEHWKDGEKINSEDVISHKTHIEYFK